MIKNYFIFFLSFSNLIFSQQLTLDKKKLLILPQDKDDEISYQITRIFSGQAVKLKRFEVIDRNNLSKILEEQALGATGIINDENIIEIGNIAGAEEGILINVLAFGQKGVKPEDEKLEDKNDREKVRKSGVVAIIARDIIKAAIENNSDKKEELYPNNIHTTLRVQYDILNLKNGQTIDSYTSYASHVGGNLAYSLSSALAIISKDTQFKLRSFYSLTSEVLDVDGNNLTMLLGSDIGVKKGSVFMIQTPEEIREIRDRTITIPGKNIGYARVEKVSVDANTSKVIRKWNKIEPGMIALENSGNTYVGSFNFGVSENSPESILNFKISSNPFGKFDPKISFQGGSLKTRFISLSEEITYESMGFGGLGIHLDYNLLNLPIGTISTGLALPFYLTSTRDDADNLVNSLLTGFLFETQFAFMINPKFDIVLNFSLPITEFNNSNWTYTKTDDSTNDSTDDSETEFDAEWINQYPPESIFEDAQISLGLRFFIFSTNNN